MPVKVFVGADHNGYHLRQGVITFLKNKGFDVADDGDKTLNPEDDFPVFAAAVVKDVLGSDDAQPMGVLICGSGQGMCMAANRFRGIRAALGYSKEAARSSRNDDDSNILCLPSRDLSLEDACDIVLLWLQTPFAAAPRFSRRIQEMDHL